MTANPSITNPDMKTTVDNERIIHSVKTALACLVGLSLAKIVHFAIDQWLIITIVVVMCGQVNVGSVLTKSKMRFLGTLSGSLIAALTLAMFDTNKIAAAFVIALSSAGFSYIATSEKSYSDAGTLGAVTVIIILIGQNPTLYTAMHRTLEISAGILIAALFSQFVLPIRARDHLRSMQAKTIAQLRTYYHFSLIEKTDENTILDIDENIVKSLAAQRKLAKEASREPFGMQFDATQFNKLLRCEKEIFRGIVCMHYACDMLPTQKNVLANMPAIKNFHQFMLTALEKIVAGINSKNLANETVTVPSIQPLKDTINVLRVSTHQDDLIYMDGFLFCAEILVIQLTELVILTTHSK